MKFGVQVRGVGTGKRNGRIERLKAAVARRRAARARPLAIETVSRAAGGRVPPQPGKR